MWSVCHDTIHSVQAKQNRIICLLSSGLLIRSSLGGIQSIVNTRFVGNVAGNVNTSGSFQGFVKFWRTLVVGSVALVISVVVRRVATVTGTRHMQCNLA
jgi:hypothetical protein